MSLCVSDHENSPVNRPDDHGIPHRWLTTPDGQFEEGAYDAPLCTASSLIYLDKAYLLRKGIDDNTGEQKGIKGIEELVTSHE